MGEHPWAESQTVIDVKSKPPLGRQGNRPREGQGLPRVGQQAGAVQGLNRVSRGPSLRLFSHLIGGQGKGSHQGSVVGEGAVLGGVGLNPGLCIYSFEHTFEVYTEGERLYLFGLESAELAREWVKCIAKVGLGEQAGVGGVCQGPG